MLRATKERFAIFSKAGPHGGRLWAEPNKGGGTVFRFRLPIASEAEQAHA